MTAAPFAAEAGNAEDGEDLTGLLGGTAPVRRGGGEAPGRRRKTTLAALLVAAGGGLALVVAKGGRGREGAPRQRQPHWQRPAGGGDAGGGPPSGRPLTHEEWEMVPVLPLPEEEPVPSYRCPVEGEVERAGNDKGDTFDDYEKFDEGVLARLGGGGEQNSQDRVGEESFRDTGYDGYGTTFSQAKENIRAWKRDHFGPPLLAAAEARGGDESSGGDPPTVTLYESACGTGRNLLMTMEILAEEWARAGARPPRVAAYGNDYVADSVRVANQFLPRRVPVGFRTGAPVCRADSTSLGHVPSGAFDLAYTGYIDMLSDPLGLMGKGEGGKDLDVSAANRASIARCTSPEQADQDLARAEQKAQEDWAARWVSELVRIARPGGTVIVEDMALPHCDILHDWGGLAKGWWREGAERYGWDVDVDSIAFADTTRAAKYGGRRYNLSMRKRGGPPRG